MNRGPRHGDIFRKDEDCEAFLSFVGDAFERFDIEVCAYVLMPNHYHLLVESVRGNLSAAMKSIAQGYSQYVNKLPGNDGSVFRGRFASKLVLEEDHWFHLPVYMHLNPVRARLVVRPNQWQWSSREYYATRSVGNKPEWLVTEKLLAEYSDLAGYRRYENEVLQKRRMPPFKFDKVLFGRRQGPVIVEKQQEIGTGVSKQKALKDVVELTGCSLRSLEETHMGPRGNAPRALAAWWMVYGAGCTNVETARTLKMTESAVAKILARWKGRGKRFKDKSLWEWQKQLLESSDLMASGRV